MLKLIFWILFLAVVLVIAALSIANRQEVMFSLDPLPFVFDLPLYLLLLAAGFIGLVLGSLSTWARGGTHRREARRLRRENAELKGQNTALARENGELKDKQQQNQNGAMDGASARQIEHHAAM